MSLCSVREHRLTFPIFVLLILVTGTLACSLGIGQSSEQSSTPTPPADQAFSLRVPVYTTSLKPGESIPGTQMLYVNRDQDKFNVTLDGLAATKRIGDSFSWKGIIAPGLIANFALRISPTLLGDNMLVAGPVDLWVLNPIPIQTDVAQLSANAIFHFSTIAVDITAPVGGQVPGTSLVYSGQSDQGANIEGSGSYPYRSIGDSLTWAGRLRGNVLVRYSFRVISFDETELHLLGTAELWVV